MRKLATIAAICGAFALSGCLSVKSYVDPSFGDYSYSQIAATDGPTPIRLETTFSTNGDNNKRAAKSIAKYLKEDFEAAGVYTVVEDENAPLLTVGVNNIANMKDAMGQGFATGLTFGLAGSTVNDGYEVTLSYDDGNGVEEGEFRHMIVSTVGNAGAPIENVEGQSALEAVKDVLEDVIVKFMQEQDADDMAFLGHAVTIF